MEALSPAEAEVVRAWPIGNSLDGFRAILHLKGLDGADFDPAIVVDQLTSKAGDDDVIGDLSLALQGQGAARRLRPRAGNAMHLRTDIATCLARFSSDQADFKPLVPLLKLVVSQKRADDHDIWAAVFDLIDTTDPRRQPTTPPNSKVAQFKQTPWSHNTGSFADTQELRSQVDKVLKQELLPSLGLDVPDLPQASFGQVTQLKELAEAAFDRCRAGDTPLYQEGRGWTRWPEDAKEEHVLAWLKEHIPLICELTDRPGLIISRQMYQGPCTYLSGSVVNRKMDVGIISRREDHDTPISDWADILVVGELKSNSKEDNQAKAWINIATYVREVFRAQDRRFVLAFSLCGSAMRLWHFDRLGNSSSLAFDINEEGYRFVHAMLGYLIMSDQQLGLDPAIRKSDKTRSIDIVRNGETERLILTRLLKRQPVIVGRGTSCWEAYREGDLSMKPLVVKNSWQYVQRPEEGQLLKVATERGVVNVARYYHHETVNVDGRDDDVVGNVRRGLMGNPGRTAFRQSSLASDGIPSEENLIGGSETRCNSRKRSASSVQDSSPTKRARISSQSMDEGNIIPNRIHRRIVTLDAGTPIEHASSLAAVLTAVIGAIKGHESLMNAGILHRDISTGNIMLTKDEDDGFLIDLDLAVRVTNDAASGAPTKTGTRVFMSIGALSGENHTFKDDLESFFWVLFWICLHWSGAGQRRKKSGYEDWNYMASHKLATFKGGIVWKEDNFERTLKRQFTQECKPLIPCMKRLRSDVFPEGQSLDENDRQLYSRMKETLVSARQALAAV